MDFQFKQHFQFSLEIILFFGLIIACLVQVWGALNLFLSHQTTTTYFKEPIKDDQVRGIHKRRTHIFEHF